MIDKFDDFLIEQELKKWEIIFNKINESNSNEELLDKISLYFEDAVEKGNEYFLKVIKKICKFFSKKSNIIVTIIFILVTRFGFTPEKIYSFFGKDSNQVEMVGEVKTKIKKEVKGIESFLNEIAKKESSDDPKKINKLGYMGKYQFGEIALKDVGLDKKINLNKFKKNPNIWPEHEQDEAMKKLLTNNKQYLGEYLSKNEGKVIAGIKLTKSGMLAGAHLLGASNVKKFIDSKGRDIPKDGFGTPITAYLKKFGGYHLPNI